MADVFSEIREILVFALVLDERQVSASSRLLEDLGADDIDIYELAAACENKFNIEIPDRMLKTFVRVGDVVRFVEYRLYTAANNNISLSADVRS